MTCFPPFSEGLEHFLKVQGTEDSVNTQILSMPMPEQARANPYIRVETS